MTNRYPGTCCGCGLSVLAGGGHLAGKDPVTGWLIECSQCRYGGPAPSADDMAYERWHRLREAEARRRVEAERLRRQRAPEPQVPACLARLGLRPPVNEDAIRSAFRRRAMESHPDRGGSAGDFVEVRRACADALRLVGVAR